MSSSHQKNLILWAGEDEEFILKGNRELKAGWWGPEARTLTTASSTMVSCAQNDDLWDLPGSGPL